MNINELDHIIIININELDYIIIMSEININELLSPPSIEYRSSLI